MPDEAIAPRYEAILLDAGGVLLDLDYRYLRRLVEVRGYDVPVERLSAAEAVARNEIEKMLRQGEKTQDPWREYFHRLLAEVSVAGAHHEALIDSLWEAHQRVGLWTVAVDGSREAVVAMRQAGLRIGVVSNAEGNVARDLDNAGYTDLFEIVVDSHQVGVSKPDPAIFRIALERMELRADRTVFVGDMPSIDIAGARAAGLAAILVDRHGTHTDVDAPRIRYLAELPALLEKA